MAAVSCSKDSVKKPVVPEGRTVTTANNPQCDDYSTEGFINRDVFRVIIVEPAGNGRSQSDITASAQNRAISTLRKYIQSNGGTLSQKTDAEIRILVEKGKLLSIKCNDSRTIYVFEIKSGNIKGKIDSLTTAR